MAKILLSKGDTFLREIVLCKERITIGRRRNNDIVIDDLAISGEHAVIVTHNNDSFLEDLNSTNGTQVNGQPVRKHFLQNEDVIELAQFRIKYLLEFQADDTVKQVSKRINNRSIQTATIRVLNGPTKGKEIFLVKSLTTLGRPGMQVAVVSHTEEGYFLAHVEGEIPKLNGKPLNGNPHPLAHGDIIEMHGIRMQMNHIANFN